MNTISKIQESAERAERELLIKRKIDDLPRLASLKSINTALGELLQAEFSFTAQIAEVIRRDPSLTTRLLKLVNSVFFGFSRRIANIEDAVFYLGLRQIRELALVTPVIEDIERMNPQFRSQNWQQLWRHSIGTAIMTREIFSASNIQLEGENDYIVGLVHNIGKIAMAIAFPEAFQKLLDAKEEPLADQVKLEEDIIGWNHGMIGAYYLRKHQLAPEVVEAVKYHHNPQDAIDNKQIAAAIHVADHLVRSVGIPSFDSEAPVEEEEILNLDGWNILYGNCEYDDKMLLTSLKHAVLRVPFILKGMV